MGEQVLELGCNAVLAYQQDFDVEGDSGIVARAYGTACVIQQRGQPPTSADAAKTNDHTLTRQVHGCYDVLCVVGGYGCRRWPADGGAGSTKRKRRHNKSTS